MFDLGIREEEAPSHWSEPCTFGECKLHQLAPYIGKLKSSIAADLISSYSREGDTVLDPFCGSGTVPLQAALMGRRPIGFDANPYAVALTRAKLSPPESLLEGRFRLSRLLTLARKVSPPDLRGVPSWVRQFFHPRTLKEAISFFEACKRVEDYFMLACLLGILHHQRPGFLSYPSSHLVPYLRTNKFPRAKFPEMYAYRDTESRMERKIERALEDESVLLNLLSLKPQVELRSVESGRVRRTVDAIITSPPYMNALDYRRDNRLRMWFLDDKTLDYSPEPTDRRGSFAVLMKAFCENVLPALRKGGYCVMVVGETVRRKRVTSHPATQVAESFADLGSKMQLVRIIEDDIPDVRRARRSYRATKTELILVFKKTKN